MDANEDHIPASANEAAAQPAQDASNANIPPPRPQPREVKQDIIGTDERNFFEKETKSKK